MSDPRRRMSAEERMKIIGRSIAVGSISSAVKKTSVAPLQRIKIVLQNNPKAFDKAYTQGISSCARYIWKTQPSGSSFLSKPFSFYRGNFTRCLTTAPTQFFSFLFKGFFKSLLFKRGVRYNLSDALFRTMLAGGLAGSLSLAFVHPMVLTATRLTSDISAVRNYRGICNCISSTIKNEGVLSLYKGFVPSVIGIFCYRACYFGFYDISKKIIQSDGKPGEKPNFFFLWFLAQSTTLASQYITYPIHTVSVRMQTSGDLKIGTRKYNGSIDCFKKIVSEEGFLALYQGGLTNIIKSGFAAFLLVFYDTLFEK